MPVAAPPAAMRDPDGCALVVLLVAFATLLATHLALVIGLASHRPRWHALVGLLVVPLAPWWGWRAGMRTRAGLWVLAAIAYVVTLAEQA
jgi:hypothetical protein